MARFSKEFYRLRLASVGGVLLLYAVMQLTGCADSDSKKNKDAVGPTQAPTQGVVGNGEVANYQASISTDGATSGATGETQAKKQVVHVVQDGDTLWAISRRYGVTVDALVRENNIRNEDLINVNQVLVIPEVPAPTTSAASGGGVKEGASAEPAILEDLPDAIDTMTYLANIEAATALGGQAFLDYLFVLLGPDFAEVIDSADAVQTILEVFVNNYQPGQSLSTTALAAN